MSHHGYYLLSLRPPGRRTYADVETGWWLADPKPQILGQKGDKVGEA